MPQSLRDRIGVDIGRRAKLESGLNWAIGNEVYDIGIQLDGGGNAMETCDDVRCEAVNGRCKSNGIHLGLHTVSGVNMAECSNIFRQAADEHLRAYVDMARGREYRVSEARAAGVHSAF